MIAAMATAFAARHPDAILGSFIFPSFRIARIDDLRTLRTRRRAAREVPRGPFLKTN
jgi:hypothetical protein